MRHFKRMDENLTFHAKKKEKIDLVYINILINCFYFIKSKTVPVFTLEELSGLIVNTYFFISLSLV